MRSQKIVDIPMANLQSNQLTDESYLTGFLKVPRKIKKNSGLNFKCDKSTHPFNRMNRLLSVIG